MNVALYVELATGGAHPFTERDPRVWAVSILVTVGLLWVQRKRKR